MKISADELVQFELDYFNKNKFPNQRYGQAVCNYFEIPEWVQNIIFYNNNTTIARDIIWQFVEGTLENKNG